METTFRTERRDARKGRELAGLWFATAGDVLRAAPREHADILWRDLRFAWRAMKARPLHTTTAMATLALGLGGSMAMFAVLDAVWLRPLSYRNPHELVMVQELVGAETSNLGYL